MSSPGYITTPLLFSPAISGRLGCKAFLKLENLQPGQSFKSRGISSVVRASLAAHGPAVHLVIASGGNAGLACARAAQQLGRLRCTVYVPLGNSQSMVDAITAANATVVIGGNNYVEAASSAAEAAARDPKGVLVHPYDDERLWDGHASIVTEIAEQLGQRPRAICCSVGGGGLLGGVIVGCQRTNWTDVPIVTLETDGAACFYYSLMASKNGEHELECIPNAQVIVHPNSHTKLVRMDPFSEATSLGASMPSQRVVEMALQRPMRCVRISDEMSKDIAVCFAEEHKMMVELACATALAPAYHKQVLEKILCGLSPEDIVVFILCGGVKISPEDLFRYKETIESLSESSKTIHIDGSPLHIGVPAL